MRAPADSLTTHMARGVGTTFLGYAGRISRPVAYVLFAHLHGAASLGLVLLEWGWLELSVRVATLGLDRALQRIVPATHENERPVVVARALALAAVASVLVAAAAAAVVPSLLHVSGNAVTHVRLSLMLALPMLTIGVTAIHAVRGAKQIVALVWARSVIEPAVFLVVGAFLALFGRGFSVLLVTLVASVASVMVVGIVTLSRELGLLRLARALGQAGGPGYVALARRALPLGAAELMGIALERGDVIAVGWILHSPALLTGYAIASDIAGVLSKLRQGFDQAFAPLAAELHAGGHADELAKAARLSSRWGMFLAAPVVLVLLVFPDRALAMFRVHEPGMAHTLMILVLGRFADVTAGPSALVLGMMGHSRQVLWNGAVGLTLASAGSRILGPLLGAPGVALAAAIGVGVASILGVTCLKRLERSGAQEGEAPVSPRPAAAWRGSICTAHA